MKINQKLNILLIVLFIMPATTFAQEKLILKKGVKRAQLKSGMKVLPISSSTTANYSDWQTVNHHKSKVSLDSIWTFDSVSSDYFYSSRIHHYEEVFFTQEEYKQLSDSERKEYRQNWERHPEPFRKGKRMKAFRKPIKEQNILPVSELQSLKFAKAKRGSKVKNAFLYATTAYGSLVALPSISYNYYYGWFVYANIYQIAFGSAIIAMSVHSMKRMNVNEYHMESWSMTVK